MKGQNYRKLAADKISEAMVITEGAETEKRDLTADEIKTVDEKIVEADKLELKAVQAEKLEERTKRYSKPTTEAIKPSVKVTLDEADREWRSLGEQLSAIGNVPNGSIDKRLERAISGASESVPSDGGFLVQQDFATELISTAMDASLGSRVRRIPLSGDSNGIDIVQFAESSRTSTVCGGVSMSWSDEGGTVTATNPKLRKTQLRLKPLRGLSYATDELLADAGALEAVTKAGFQEAFTYKIEDAIINGDGTGKPTGILNSNCIIQVSKETNQTADTVVYENVVKMYSRLAPRSFAKSIWIVNQNVIPQLMQMSLAVGAGGSAAWMAPSGLSGSPYSTLISRPVVISEHAATIGDAGDIILADLSQMAWIEKSGLETASSLHVRFIYGEQTFRFTYRCDGASLWANAVSPAKGSSYSPFIRLQARA